MAGYTTLTLIPIADTGAVIIAPHAFGGDNSIRSWIGLLVLLTTICLVLAYVNIKRLRIDRHRAWMLRAWALFASIITLRIILIIAASITAHWPYAVRHVAMPCGQIIATFNNNFEAAHARYPECNSSSIDIYAVVVGQFKGGNPAMSAAAMQSTFGMAGWIATTLHIIGVEWYLWATPAETERLRKVSYERRMERGMVDKTKRDSDATLGELPDEGVVGNMVGEKYSGIPY